jgi:release factor glutamine methyltransferase
LAEAAVASSLTVAQAVAGGTAALSSSGSSDSPRLDAELLLSEVLGVSRARLVIDRDEVVVPEALERFRGLVERRAAHEPVAYILGRKGFRRLELSVDRRVLIPRPETELLVEVGLELDAGSSVVDVGTGSGAVALALADERPDLVVTGIDVSADAVSVARDNAARLGLDVRFVVGDLLVGCARFDAILANLPYVESDAALPADVAEFEPASALFAGADGLDVVRRLMAAVGALATGDRPELIALEIAPAQAGVVAGLVGDAGFPSVEVRRDLAGRERLVVGRDLAGRERVVVGRA